MLILLCLGVIVCIGLFSSPRRYSRHTHNVKTANKVLNTLSTLSFPGQKFHYLRQIDPFVFEELLLCAFERKGHVVIRNSRYTGDGGIDGKVIIDDRLTFIQAKRYTSFVNAQHIVNFSNICHRKKVPGLFIHCGKTGHKARILTPKNVTVIGGHALLELLDEPK